MSLKKVSSIELAKYIRAYCGRMNHLKLQKLIYYCEAWHLAYFETSLIEDDFQAWVHGPVSIKVWEHYKTDSVLYNDLPGFSENVKGSIISKFSIKVTNDQLDLINDVLKEYGGKSSYQLECLTHVELPWREARGGLAINEYSSIIINKTTMKDYYKKQLYQI